VSAVRTVTTLRTELSGDGNPKGAKNVCPALRTSKLAQEA